MRSLYNIFTEGLLLKKGMPLLYKKVLDYDKYKDKLNDQFTEQEITDIVRLASKLPVEPDKIRLGKTGCIVLEYPSSRVFELKHRITISKPDRYEGCFKITWTIPHKYMPYEFPAANKFTDSKGNLLLATPEDVFNKINDQWKKRDITKFINDGWGQ